MLESPKVFLSYAREDRSRVEKFYDSLRKEGFIPWMDTRDIIPGSEWSKIIQENIKQSDFIIIFISRNSVSKRGYVQSEIRSALNVLSTRPAEEIFLIPVRLDDSQLPNILSHIQYVDLFEKEGWSNLLKSLQHVREKSSRAIEKTEELKAEIQKDGFIDKTEDKKHIFVAMPFNIEMEDIYHYGIMPSVIANGFRCERIDKTAFTGDILVQIKERIKNSVAVIAELTGFNPNVHVELGYAWGKEIPTILLLKNGSELCFDVKGQKCLMYHNIKNLEELIYEELKILRSDGRIAS